MIRRAKDMTPEIIEGMRGGKGSAEVLRVMQNDEFHNKGRLFAKVTLKPGCSIGMHQHVGDCESYYITKGEGTVNEDGTLSIVKAGDLVYTDNMESHSIENTGSEDLELIALVLYV